MPMLHCGGSMRMLDCCLVYLLALVMITIMCMHVYTVSQKNAPPLTCYNLDVHNPITTIFGRSVTKKVRNQTLHCFEFTYLEVLHYLAK